MNKEQKEYSQEESYYNPFKTFYKIKNTYSGYVAARRTKHVVKILLCVYIPLIILWIYLFYRINYLSLPFLFLILISVFPFCKNILIKLSENKYHEIRENIYSMKSCKNCYYLKNNKCEFANKYIQNLNSGEFVACNKYKGKDD